MFAGGRLLNMASRMTESSKQTFLNRGIIEEAIASSQLEGAHTTRKAAKDMLIPVSYTHLDVYKRQLFSILGFFFNISLVGLHLYE